MQLPPGPHLQRLAEEAVQKSPFAQTPVVVNVLVAIGTGMAKVVRPLGILETLQIEPEGPEEWLGVLETTLGPLWETSPCVCRLRRAMTRV